MLSCLLINGAQASPVCTPPPLFLVGSAAEKVLSGCMAVLRDRTSGVGEGRSASNSAASLCFCPVGPVSTCLLSCSSLRRDLTALPVPLACRARRETSLPGLQVPGNKFWVELQEWNGWEVVATSASGIPALCIELGHLVNTSLWAHSPSHWLWVGLL